MKILLLAPFNPTDSTENLTQEQLKILNNYVKPIYSTLINLGHSVSVETNPDKLPMYQKNVDKVFSIYTRIYFKNYEVYIANICNYYNMSCNGAIYSIKSLAEDKVFTKIFAKHLEVLTPNWFELTYKEPLPQNLPFSPPYFIKPRNSGASFGITQNSVCVDYESLKVQFELLRSNKVNCLVESQIKGPLISVPIIKANENLYTCVYKLETNEPNGIITHEIKKGLQSTYTCKRTSSKTDIDTEAIETSIKMFNALKECGYARFDYVRDENTKKLFFLEFNTCPNIQEQSGFYLTIKEKYDIDYMTFLNLILQSYVQ